MICAGSGSLLAAFILAMSLLDNLRLSYSITSVLLWYISEAPGVMNTDNQDIPLLVTEGK